MSKTNFEKVQEFHKAFNLSNHTIPAVPEQNKVKLRIKLIREEFFELMAELEDKEEIDLPKVAKEAADLLYVVYGLGADFGIDLDASYAAVHESNMSKLDDNGKPIYNEFGKVMKSDRYKEPNMVSVLNAQRENK